MYISSPCKKNEYKSVVWIAGLDNRFRQPVGFQLTLGPSGRNDDQRKYQYRQKNLAGDDSELTDTETVDDVVARMLDYRA